MRQAWAKLRESAALPNVGPDTTLDVFCMSTNKHRPGYALWQAMNQLRVDYNLFLTSLRQSDLMKCLIPPFGERKLMLIDAENFLEPFVLEVQQGNDNDDQLVEEMLRDVLEPSAIKVPLHGVQNRCYCLRAVVDKLIDKYFSGLCFIRPQEGNIAGRDDLAEFKYAESQGGND